MVTVINYSTMETPIITYQMGWFILYHPFFVTLGVPYDLLFLSAMTNEVFYYLCFTCFLYLEYMYSSIYSSSINHQWNLFLYKCVSPCFTYSHSYDDEPPTVSFWALRRLRHAWRLSPWSEARASFSSDSDFRSDLGGRSPSKNCTFFTIKIWAFTIKLWAFTIKIWVFKRWGNLPKTYDFIDGPTPFFIRRGFGMHSSQQAFLSKPLVFVCVSSVFFQNPYLYARVFL